MAAGTLAVLDAAGVSRFTPTVDTVVGSDTIKTPVSLEDADQRAALLAALVGSGFFVGQPSPLTTTAQLVVAARAGRRKAVVTLMAAGTPVFFGKDSTVTSSNGDYQPGIDGGEKVFETGSAIWAILPAGSAPLAVSYAEYF